jgi:hypothetical protein
MARLSVAAPRSFHRKWLTTIRVMKSINTKGSTPRQPGASNSDPTDRPHYLRILKGIRTIFDRASGAHAGPSRRAGPHIPEHS